MQRKGVLLRAVIRFHRQDAMDTDWAMQRKSKRMHQRKGVLLRAVIRFHRDRLAQTGQTYLAIRYRQKRFPPQNIPSLLLVTRLIL